jgi:hypothetical protein
MQDGCEHSTSGATDFGKQMNHNSKFIYWLFMNSCKCQSLIYATTKVLNYAKEGQLHQLLRDYFQK